MQRGSERSPKGVRVTTVDLRLRFLLLPQLLRLKEQGFDERKVTDLIVPHYRSLLARKTRLGTSERPSARSLMPR